MTADLTWWQSSATDDWSTHQATFNTLNAEFSFTLDPCASHCNAKCARYFTKDDDGLAQSWSGKIVFMNPPYGREIGHWVKKAVEAAHQGSTVVGLVPARPDTRWWHDHVANVAEVRFVKGRLRFGDGRYPAPFPSAIVVWTPQSVTARCNCGRALQGRSDKRHHSNACRQAIARGHGDSIGAYAERLLSGEQPWMKMRQTYKLFSLVRRHGAVPVNDACAKALELDVIDVSLIERIAERGGAAEVRSGRRKDNVVELRFTRDASDFRAEERRDE